MLIIDYVSGIIKYDERIFILANRFSEAESCNAVVLELLSDGLLTNLLDIKIAMPAMSFEYDGNAFYTGIVMKESPAEVNNKILIIDYEV